MITGVLILMVLLGFLIVLVIGLYFLIISKKSKKTETDFKKEIDKIGKK